MATPNGDAYSEPYVVIKTTCHGLPYRPSCMTYDPLQQLLAIGSHHGVVTILGRTALERRLEHGAGYGVLQLQFGINRGLLLSLVCSKEGGTAISLWSFVTKNIVLLDTIEISHEKLRSVYWPYDSDWIYLGCEGGNVRFASVQSRGNHHQFVKSHDVIYWNKAAQLRSCRRDNPGEVLVMQENPLDPSKLMVGYSEGLCLVWNSKEKTPLLRHTREMAQSAMTMLTCACWHSNGKAIVVGYTDGCVLEVEVKTGQILHMLNVNTGGGMLGCLPIFGLQCYSVKDGDPWVLFSGGGLLRDQQSAQTLTVWTKNAVKELQFAGSFVDFICLPSSPFPAETQSPSALVILTDQELLAFDMKCDLQVESPSPISLPYMLLHPTPVTCLLYCGLCPTELEPQLIMIKTKLSMPKAKESGSPKLWPIHGGDWDVQAIGRCPRLIVTGHQDGTVRFWLSYEDIFEPAFSVNTASYFVRTSAIQHALKKMGGASPLPSHKAGGHTIEKSSGDGGTFGIEFVKVSLAQQNFCVVNERGDVLLFKMDLSKRHDTVKAHNITLHLEDTAEEDELDGLGPPVSEDLWKFEPMPSGDGRLSLKLIQHCRCMVDKNGSMQAVRVNSLDYCPSTGMLAVGTNYGIAVLDTVTNSCGNIITSNKTLMSQADPSFSASVKRVRMHGKHKMKVKQPFKLLTTKRNTASSASAPQTHTTSLSCEITVVTTMYLCLEADNSTPCLTLWVGTATGEVAVLGIQNRGGSNEKRLELIPTGITINKPNKVIDLLFLSDKIAKIEPASEHQSSKAATMSVPSYVVLTTTDLLKSYTLPDKKCCSRCPLMEDKGEIVSSSYSVIEERPLLVTLLSTSQLLIHSLPDLQPMAELSSLPIKGPSALDTFSLGILGRGVYKRSPTEIQEVTVLSSAIDTSSVWKYLPQLYIARDNPPSTPKSKRFVSNLLSPHNQQTSVNRGELFSTVADKSPILGGGKTSRHAHLTASAPGHGNDMRDGGADVSPPRTNRYAASGPYSQITEHLHERKQKLSKLADTTENFADDASQFSSIAKQLRDKYRK